MTQEAQMLTCPAHPAVQTVLRCSKCERPICPRCMVETPVGWRCRECAQLRRPPLYEVTMPLYLRAGAAGLGFALAGALLWSLIPPSGLLGLVVAYGLGYAIGEGVGWAANRKRGVGLQIIAAGSITLAWGLPSLALGLPNAWGLLALPLALTSALSRLR